MTESKISKIETVNHSFSKVPLTKKLVKGKIDSGASSNYIHPEDAHILEQVTKQPGPPVTLPDAGVIKPTHKGILPLSAELSNTAKTATVLPGLKSGSLISTGKICDDDNMVIFDKDSVKAIPHSNEVVQAINKQPILLEGKRNPIDSLYDTTINSNPSRFKTKIQSNVFEIPQVHPHIYLEQTAKNDSVRKQIHPQSQKKKKTTFKLKMTLIAYLRSSENRI